MNILFLNRYDPKDIQNWSGTLYHMYHELCKKHCVDTMGAEIIGQISEFERGSFPENVFISPTENIKSINRLLSERINATNCDLIFFGDLIFIPFLDVKMPIICVSDMTFEQNRLYYTQPNEVHDEFSLLFESLALQNASNIIYSSEWIKGKAVEFYGVDPQKIHVIEFGANIPYPQDYSIEISMDICNLVFIGADWKRKGGNTLLKTYRILKEAGFPCSLTIIGSIPEYIPYDDDNSITIFPKLDKSDSKQLAKLCGILKNSHFLFLPTIFDAFGIVFCEASAYALPSISANVGGVSQAISEGKNGFLLPTDATPQNYADKIIATFNDKDRYVRLRASSRIEFETRLNWNVWGERVNKIMEESVKENKLSTKIDNITNHQKN